MATVWRPEQLSGKIDEMLRATRSWHVEASAAHSDHERHFTGVSRVAPQAIEERR
jgi:hypothetical protein